MNFIHELQSAVHKLLSVCYLISYKNSGFWVNLEFFAQLFWNIR